MYYVIRAISNEGEYFLVNGWNKRKSFWTKKLSEAVFTSKLSAKGSLTKLLKVMDDYAADRFELISVPSLGAEFSEWKYEPYTPKVKLETRFVADINSEILKGNSLTAIKRAASEIANKKVEAVDTLDVYDSETGTHSVFHRHNKIAPNNTVERGSWR